MKALFACDIDNTLLYSYKKKQDGYICIELNKGREQGFMSQYTHENFLRMTEKVIFVPVTTRSVEQYRRIVFPFGYVPEYAVVTNGATLIHNGEICTDWNLIERGESLTVQLEEIYNHYCNDSRFINCRIVDDSYIFVYCADGTDVEKTARQLAENTGMNVEASGRKIYFFPDNLNKGNAVARLKNKLDSEYIISAGDSIMDLSMLNTADTALVPCDFDVPFHEHSGVIKSYENSLFSDFVIDYIINKLRN